MALGSISLQMGKPTKATTLMTRNMATGYTPGLMGRSTQAGGCWASRMVMGSTHNKEMRLLPNNMMKCKQSMVYGKMGRRSPGWTTSRSRVFRVIGYKQIQIKRCFMNRRKG